jgi:hypothetical protein
MGSANVTLYAQWKDITIPSLAVTTLPNGAYTNNASLNISGTATDNSGIKSLTVNGAVITVEVDGSFKTATTLTNGANTITIIATDIADNIKSDTRTIYLDQTAPIITITTPTDNSTVFSNSFSVNGSVNGSAAVRVVNNGAVVQTFANVISFSVTVYPAEGLNTIQIIATDLAGNTATATRSVDHHTLNGLSISDVTYHYSSPYLLDFEFTLRDNNDAAVGHAVEVPVNLITMTCKEDATAISPTETAYIVARGDRKQLRSILVLDYTASMQFGVPDTNGNGISDAIENMEAAAKGFINQQSPEAVFGLWEFHADFIAPQKVSGFTSDKAALGKAIDGILPTYVKGMYAGTRAWDAVLAAINEFGPPTRDELRTVVFMSDGFDDSSVNGGPTQVISAALAKGVKLYCVAFGSPNTSTLQQITSQTKGRYYYATSAANLTTQFQQVNKDLGGQYLLRWATMKRSATAFSPSFQVTLGGYTATFTGGVPLYVPTSYAGNVLIGSLRMVADADLRPQTVMLRAAYVPRYIHKLRVHYRANYPCTAELRSNGTGEFLAGWSLTETSDGSGGKWLELTSPKPDNLTTSIPYGSMGNLIAFKFTGLPAGQQAFSLIDVDNSFYTEGQSFTLENAGAFIATLSAYPIITSAGLHGTITPGQSIPTGGTFTVTVTPHPNYHIDTVLVDGVAQSVSNPKAYNITFTSVGSPHSVSANFAPDSYLLSVSKDGTGSGTVSSDVGAIFCGAVCSDNYLFGSKVFLYALAVGNAQFTGWNGGGCTGKGTCTVTIPGPLTVTATFNAPPKVQVGSKEFATLQAAYDDNATITGSVIRMLDGIDAGPLTANRSVTVTISGGYNTAYTAQTGSTDLLGKVTLQKGTVIFDRVTVR